ncbi:MAG: sensor domain-containing diguanylate cyclase [Planctomycetes bacterium]|nr:sensor domain-containing diguanylate cyclase [Planctomycetota bacterium]
MYEEPWIADGWLQRHPRAMLAAILLLVAGVFAVDISLPTHTAVGSLYAVPLLISLWLERRKITLSVAWVCVVLTLATVFLHDSEDKLEVIVASRAATVFSISVATMLGLMRLKAERELRFVRKTALTTLRSLGEAVLTTTNDGRVRFVNRVAERLLDQPRAKLLNRPLNEVFVVQDQNERPPILELVEKGLTEQREALLFDATGARLPIEYTRTPILSADGERYGTVVVFRDITARKEHEEAIKRLAYRDELTGLPNRTSLLDRLQLELAHAKRNRESLGVVYLDLDGFKQVNDTCGHEGGDELLRHVAQRMSSTLRAGDTVARLGGDEFVVLLPAVAGLEEARRVGEKLVAAIEQPVEWKRHQMRASASVGIALYPRDGTEPDTLMRRADKAMYRAKSAGAGRVAVVSSLDETQFDA